MNYDPIIYGGVGLIIGAISLWLGRRWGRSGRPVKFEFPLNPRFAMYAFGVLCLLYGFSYRIGGLTGEGDAYTIGLFAIVISAMMKD